AEPQDHPTDGAPRQVVRRRGAASILLELPSQPWTEGHGTGEGDEAADRVDDRGPCEVTEHGPVGERGQGVERHVAEPAARTPRPVAEDRVDEPGDGDRVPDVADER